jgi:hypothetical protein
MEYQRSLAFTDPPSLPASPPGHQRYANQSVSLVAGRGGGEGWRIGERQ